MTRRSGEDKDLQSASKRRITAIWKIGWMGAGIIAALVLLYFDILYSADGMIPIFGKSESAFYLCWALSIIMSPIEMATSSIMTDPDQRAELGPDARAIGMTIGSLVFVADIVTNWLGLYLSAAADGIVTTLNYLVIFVVGGILAFVEYVIEFLVSLLSKEIANFKVANQEFQEWHEQHGQSSRSHSRGNSPRSHSRPPGGSPRRPGGTPNMGRPSRDDGFRDRPAPRGRTM